MRKPRKTVVGLVGAAVAVLAAAGPAAAEVETARGVSVLGRAEIDTHDPYSVFEFSVHARGSGHSGEGVIWISHHDDERIGWMVGRVDCVRAKGRTAVVTAIVSDAKDFLVGPGDPVALTVHDRGRQDTIEMAGGEAVTPCRTSPQPEHRLTRGDFRILAR